MGFTAILFSIALAMLTTPALAGNPMACWMDTPHSCGQFIGKRIWIWNPRARDYVVEATTTKGDWTTSRTIKLKSGASFLIQAVDPGANYSYDYRVTLQDGRTAWIGTSSPFLFDFDPVAQAKQNQAECERRGQPKIGMTPAELVASCWGKPRRIIKKTTAAGVEENYVYTIGHIVKLTDGKVSEIVEASQ